MNDHDKAMTQAAADAAGIPLVWGGPDKDMARRSDSWANWNPLADDGDALRLMAAMRLMVEVSDDGHEARADSFFGHHYNVLTGDDGDIVAALRRAIVSVAAMLPPATQPSNPP